MQNVVAKAAINIAVQFKTKALHSSSIHVQFKLAHALLLFSLKNMKTPSYSAIDSYFQRLSPIKYVFFKKKLIVKGIASFVCRYHYNVADSRLHSHVEKGNQDGLYISSVASSENFWALIMDAGTGFCSQVYELSQVFLHKVHFDLFLSNAPPSLS